VATSPNVDPKLKALGLTPRMIDVLALLLQGHSNKAIARHLGISPHTVTDYVSIILERLEVSSRSQVPLKVQALQQSLLDWDAARRLRAALCGHV
jgi:DNA-binding NarL/FixJ family response regulator